MCQVTLLTLGMVMMPGLWSCPDPPPSLLAWALASNTPLGRTTATSPVSGLLPSLDRLQWPLERIIGQEFAKTRPVMRGSVGKYFAVERRGCVFSLIYSWLAGNREM